LKPISLKNTVQSSRAKLQKIPQAEILWATALFGLKGTLMHQLQWKISKKAIQNTQSTGTSTVISARHYNSIKIFFFLAGKIADLILACSKVF
jgi:hypothetical protein